MTALRSSGRRSGRYSTTIGHVQGRAQATRRRAARAGGPYSPVTTDTGVPEEQTDDPPGADRRPDRHPARDPVDGQELRRQGDHPARAGARARRHLPAGDRRRAQGAGHLRADDPRGVRRAGRVAADLRAGGRGDRPRLDERLRRHQHPLHRRLHDHPARHAGAEGALPAADGHRRGARRVLDVRARAGLRRRRHPHQGHQAGRRRLRHRRPEDVADQRRQLHPGRRAGAHRRGRGEGPPEPDDVPGREADRLRRGHARPDHPRQDRQDGLQGRRHHRAGVRRLPRPRPTTSSAGRPAAASPR